MRPRGASCSRIWEGLLHRLLALIMLVAISGAGVAAVYSPDVRTQQLASTESVCSYTALGDVTHCN